MSKNYTDDNGCFEKGRNYTERLSCSTETKQLIMEECKSEFLKFNPKFRGFNLSQGFMLRRIAEHYLESEPR